MIKSRLIRISAVVALVFCSGPSSPLAAGEASKLPALNADPTRTSVSGLSSGAFMAVQYDVAFSASVVGIGVVAGGPYNCALVNVGGISTCMQGAPLGSASYGAAVGFATSGQIDPVANLAKGKVYLFSGTNDHVVLQTVMNATRDFYTLAGVPAGNLVYLNSVPAGHAFISPDFGIVCSTTAAPYVNECTVGDSLYDQPAAILTHIYGPLKPKSQMLSAKPVAFNQTEFAGAPTGMADTGYVYIPASCQNAPANACVVHIVFHGCGQGAREVHDAVYGKVGYNEWADANNIIVLYPQLDPTIIPSNQAGCWDWWGYTGVNFQTKSGQQLSAIRAMVNRLTAKPRFPR